VAGRTALRAALLLTHFMRQDRFSRPGLDTRIQVLEVIGNAIVGGTEHHVESLVRHLPPDRFAVTALCPFESAFTRRLRRSDVEVVVAPMPDEPLSASIRTACARIRAHAIDVLHAHLPNAHALAGIAGRLARKPVLATLHGHRIGRLDLETHRRAGTHLSVVCRQSYFEALALGVGAKRLSCNPNGVDNDLFRPRPRPADGLRAALGIPAAAPVVGFLGRLSPEKGPEVFLEAAALATSRLPDVRFVLVGDGPLAAPLAAAVARRRLPHRVHLAGLRHDVPALLNELDVLVSSSHSEAMPLAVMEAMSCGLAVVATRVGGVPDMIEDGVSGWLVEPGDAAALAARVVQVLETPGERERLGRAARARAIVHMDLADSVARAAQSLACLVGSPVVGARSATRDGRSCGLPATAAHGMPVSPPSRASTGVLR